jgi:undecaprenyl-diphosphatase
MAIDWTVFQWFNSLAGRWPVLDAVVRLVMNDYALPTALVLSLFALWFAGGSPAIREQHQRAVFSAIGSMVLGNLIVKALNLVLYRPRPFAFHTVTLLFYRPSDSSFPSNPASVGFSIATAVWLFNHRIGLLLYALATLFGLSRVVGGVHYPSDVLGGALIGSMASYLIVRKFRLLDRLWTGIIQRVRRFLLA